MVGEKITRNSKEGGEGERNGEWKENVKICGWNMSKNNKVNLYLVSTPGIKKKFDMFYVFMCDESIFEYKLDEVKISLVDEWVEVERIDKTSMEQFMSHNIMRIKFMKNVVKSVPNENRIVDLKPVV